jgi:putative ABC transport system substrate-binding protein
MTKHRLVILTFLGIFFCQISTAVAQEAFVVKSDNLQPYNEAFEGIKETFKADVKEIILTEADDSKIIEKISSAGPRLIFAIGQNALSRIRVIKDIPIVYAMVSNPRALLSGEKNITGVSMNVSAGQQLNALLEILPGAKRIGIVYDPQKTGHLFEEARRAALFREVTLISREVSSPREAPSAIDDLKGEIDAFWMLPDTTVLTQESVKYLFLFSFENNIPVLSFSKKYIKMGSLISLNIDAVNIGRQAGKMANQILAGKDMGNIIKTAPIKSVMTVNPWVAGRFENINSKLIQKVEN